MPLFDQDEDSPNKPLPAFDPNPQPYKGINVDTEFNPVGTILTAIEGKSWLVTFYSAIYNDDNEVASFQPSRLEINQQYKRINRTELKVTIPLPPNPDFDPQSKEFTVRGEANMYPGIRPNIGDMFTAPLLDGRVGLFQISTPPEQRTIYLQTTYRIEYVLYKFLDQSIQRKLDDKVINDYYFIPSFLDSGINPVITESSYHDYGKLTEIREKFPLFYLTKYFNKEYATLIIPGQGRAAVYDPFFTTFVSALWGQGDLGQFNGQRFLTVMDGTVRRYVTVLSALLDGNGSLMDLAETKMPVINSMAFMREPYFQGAGYMGVPYVVYPSNLDDYTFSINEKKNMVYKLVNGYKKQPKVRFRLDQLYPEGTLVPDATFSNKRIKDVTIDDYYIFSEDFYSNRDENLSTVESLVWEVLNEKSIPAPVILELFEESRNWDDLNHFYYTPILYALINAAMRGLSG